MSIPLSNSVKQQLLTQLFDQLDDAIFILDAKLCYLSVNAAYEIIIGYNQEFLFGRPLGIYNAEFLSDNERAILQDISSCLNEVGLYKKDFSLVTRYGQTLNCHMTYRRLYLDGDVYYVAIVRDISSIVNDQKQVSHLLNFDQLTGLPNRKVFLSQTSDLIMEYEHKVVIARFNIDGYSNFASILGTDKTNSLIISFVERVNALQLQYMSCFSHFGGDDFALSFKCSNINNVNRELYRLMQVCEQPFILDESHSLSYKDRDNTELSKSNLVKSVISSYKLPESTRLSDKKIYLHFSIGASTYPEDDNQLLGLLSKAEKALHHVKEQGGDGVNWYRPELSTATKASLNLETELRSAIENHQFIVFYQPKVKLINGEIVGFEALVRWQHPTRGLLKPDSFIDAIVKYKLSFELFCQMAIQITKDLEYWRTLGFYQYVCINANAAEFSHPDFFNFVSGLFVQTSLEPQQINIEITESSLMLQHAYVKKQLLALKSLGIGLALDDFGTGYSSLSYLREYPFDYIKIDKSFIVDIVDNKTQQAIVKAILDLAAALDMGTIAEGIETKQQRDLLHEMGCTYAQGYWFGYPVKTSVATAMLTQGSP